ncbi:MAG: purine-binding chemotaxis protein CheW [Candidatus Magnetomorum sp.]|nr:purine-binding chemotaxis protein CheW [Candidatus Magnetomorum sp.]
MEVGVSKQTSEKNDKVDLATFYVSEALCGMDILRIQEINKNMEITSVPNSPAHVVGVLNMRGRIVTIIDVCKKLGLSKTEATASRRNIIVYSQNEYVGMLVDRVAEVVPAEWNKVTPPPSNVRGVQGKYFEGVYKTKDGLIAILDIEEVLKDDSVV